MNEKQALKYFERDRGDVDLINDLAVYANTGKGADSLVRQRDRLVRLLQRLLLDRDAMMAYFRLLLNRHVDPSERPEISEDDQDAVDKLVFSNRIEQVSDEKLFMLASDPAWLSTLYDILPEFMGEDWYELLEEQGQKVMRTLNIGSTEVETMLRRVHDIDDSSPVGSLDGLAVDGVGGGWRSAATTGEPAAESSEWMNFGPNGMVVTLPEPIVSRCFDADVGPVALKLRVMPASGGKDQVKVQLSINPAPKTDGFSVKVVTPDGLEATMIFLKGHTESTSSEELPASKWPEHARRIRVLFW